MKLKSGLKLIAHFHTVSPEYFIFTFTIREILVNKQKTVNIPLGFTLEGNKIKNSYT